MKAWSSAVAIVCGLWMVLFSVRADGAPTAAKAALPGVALTAYDASIGSPIAVENLTVFPIYAVENPEFSEAVSLELALERGTAKVREVGTAQEGGDAATVGAIVIDNLGDAPIVVLAGTVVKGGKQDRQVAQDFVVAVRDSMDVEAFCVEHGRWTSEREGKNTGGKFSASGMLAPRKVRMAAQHDSDQGKVWDEVAETNRKAKKSAKSGTLMATLDAADVKKERRALSKAAAREVDAVPSADKVLGVAYAVDGEVRGVRWFASRSLFEQHQTKLLESAAVEAVLAADDSAAARRGDDKGKKITARDVKRFIDDVGRSKVTATKKRPKALNTNVYKSSKRARASEARVKSTKKKTSLGDPADMPLTIDISAQ